VTVAFLILAFLSYGFFPNAITQPLEYEYPPVQGIDDQGVKWVVVLGGGHISAPGLPPNSQITDTCMMRLIEGIRLHRAITGSRLLLSGGTGFDSVSDAEIMAQVAEIIGVDRANIVLEAESWDTEDEARLIKDMVGNDTFVLVTSAAHMPRSIALFRKQGMEPIPAPTDFTIRESQGGLHPGSFFPGALSIRQVEMAMHEYLGMAWARLRGSL
ncbi:MAG: envelope biogenesis factor ElyC, partial [Desulfobacteraceae bacterium]